MIHFKGKDRGLVVVSNRLPFYKSIDEKGNAAWTKAAGGLITALEPIGEDDEEIESPSWLEDPGESPEEAALRMELNKAIQHCIEELDEDFRAVVVLVDVQGMDYAEASEVVKTPLGTIKSRLARARSRLKDCLRGFGELLPAVFRLEGERIA